MIQFWSALTCQRFGSVATCRDLRLIELSKNVGVRPPKTKALTGQRTPKFAATHREFR
jgi:hypothetical protein